MHQREVNGEGSFREAFLESAGGVHRVGSEQPLNLCLI